MNIALSTLILFLFLGPGIVYRKLYYAEEFSKQYFKQSFFELLFSTLFPSIIFQTIWFFGCRITSYQVDLILFINLMTGHALDKVAENIESFSYQILIYQGSMLLVAAAYGYFSRKIIRHFKIDRRIKLFRFQNHWHYYLTGEFFDYPRANIRLVEDDVRDIEFVFVDALIETKECSYLVSGQLVDYELSRNGGLDSFSLTGVSRIKVSDYKEGLLPTDDDYIQIDTHIFILKYSEVRNINLQFYKFKRFEDGSVLPQRVLNSDSTQ